MRFDGVLTFAARIPRGCGPGPTARNEFGAVLFEDDIDALGAVDLADAGQFVERKFPDLDGRLHPCNLAVRT